MILGLPATTALTICGTMVGIGAMLITWAIKYSPDE